MSVVPNICARGAEYLCGGAEYLCGGAQYLCGGAEYLCGGAEYLCGGAEYLWVLGIELTSCHLYGAHNFEVAPRFLDS